MKSRLILMLASFICLTTVAKAITERDVVEELKKTQYGLLFFNNHSENDFILVLDFLNNPICFFKKVKKINRLFEYIEIYERFSVEKQLTNENVFKAFLEKHFVDINNKKAEILSFLLLSSDGMYGELLADKYIRLFKKCPMIFINSLKKYDWRRIVDRLDSGNWQELKSGLDKLGDSKYELTFKSYVLAPRDEKGQRIR